MPKGFMRLLPEPPRPFGRTADPRAVGKLFLPEESSSRRRAASWMLTDADLSELADRG